MLKSDKIFDKTRKDYYLNVVIKTDFETLTKNQIFTNIILLFSAKFICFVQ